MPAEVKHTPRTTQRIEAPPLWYLMVGLLLSLWLAGGLDPQDLGTHSLPGRFLIGILIVIRFALAVALYRHQRSTGRWIAGLRAMWSTVAILAVCLAEVGGLRGYTVMPGMIPLGCSLLRLSGWAGVSWHWRLMSPTLRLDGFLATSVWFWQVAGFAFALDS
jgi:hypothetical protein